MNLTRQKTTLIPLGRHNQNHWIILCHHILSVTQTIIPLTIMFLTIILHSIKMMIKLKILLILTLLKIILSLIILIMWIWRQDNSRDYIRIFLININLNKIDIIHPIKNM